MCYTIDDFKIGDKVLVIKNIENIKTENKIGVILEKDSGSLGIRFYESNSSFHDLMGKCEDGYGWYIFASSEYGEIQQNGKYPVPIKKIGDKSLINFF